MDENSTTVRRDEDACEGDETMVNGMTQSDGETIELSATFPPGNTSGAIPGDALNSCPLGSRACTWPHCMPARRRHVAQGPSYGLSWTGVGGGEKSGGG